MCEFQAAHPISQVTKSARCAHHKQCARAHLQPGVQGCSAGPWQWPPPAGRRRSRLLTPVAHGAWPRARRRCRPPPPRRSDTPSASCCACARAAGAARRPPAARAARRARPARGGAGWLSLQALAAVSCQDSTTPANRITRHGTVKTHKAPSLPAQTNHSILPRWPSLAEPCSCSACPQACPNPCTHPSRPTHLGQKIVSSAVHQPPRRHKAHPTLTPAQPPAAPHMRSTRWRWHSFTPIHSLGTTIHTLDE